MNISPLAGKPAGPSLLVDVPRLITAYYAERPDPSVPSQRVAFGTSGHRGSALERSFKLDDVLTIPHIRRVSISPFADVDASAWRSTQQR